MRRMVVTMALLGSALLGRPSCAFDLAGTKTITLVARDGKTYPIGRVTFTPKGDASTFVVDVDPAKFKTYFLSMRDFKCLEGPELECDVPYPYKTPGTASPTDLRWLAHSLLFFYKNPADYGAKLTNGLYYDLKMTPSGIEGRPEAIDLDAIAAPPDDLSKPPYDKDSRSEIEDGARWISKLTITDK